MDAKIVALRIVNLLILTDSHDRCNFLFDRRKQEIWVTTYLLLIENCRTEQIFI